MNKSKKIGLVTIHHANSYGGVLQAYATQTILSRFGDVKIVDYKTEHLRKTMSLVRFGDGPRGVLRAAKDVLRLVPRKRLLDNFRRFFSENYRLSESVKNSEDALNVFRNFDVMVSGSDQIWNPKVIDGLDPVYFLGGGASCRRVAYASSSGSYRFSPAEWEVVRPYLERYDALAVREHDTADYLSRELGRNVGQVIDPTLLLSKHEWCQVINPPTDNALQGKYILVYTLKKNKLVRDSVAYIARKLNMTVVAIDQDPYLGFKVDRHVNSAGPKDFVSLFLNASFVVTNSFHGTAFSLNFEKPFVVIEPESGVNRIEGLLEDVGLGGHLVNSLSNVDRALSCEFDYEKISCLLSLARRRSIDYLEASLLG